MYQSPFLNEIKESAKRLGFQVLKTDTVNGRVIRVGNPTNRMAFFGASPLKAWPFNNMINCAMVTDKELCCRILKSAGLNVPKTQIGFYDLSVYSHLENIPKSIYEVVESFPEKTFIIKPNDACSAKGLSFIYEKESTKEGIELAAKQGNAILIQEIVDGVDCRIYTYKDKPIARLERSIPPLEQNVNWKKRLENADRLEEKLSIQSFLKSEFYSINQNPRFNPYPISNFSCTGDHGKLSGVYSEEECSMASTVYKAFGLNFSAIDYKLNPVTGKIHILEVNSNPGISALFKREDKKEQVEAIIDFLVQKAVETGQQITIV